MAARRLCHPYFDANARSQSMFRSRGISEHRPPVDSRDMSIYRVHDTTGEDLGFSSTPPPIRAR